MNREEREILAAHGRSLASIFSELQLLKQRLLELEKRLLVLEAEEVKNNGKK
ncbi:MAG: hypothetical protein QW179_02365 [Candidatus Hadarchaeales archaeon]